MTAIIITFGLVGCWCLMAHNNNVCVRLFSFSQPTEKKKKLKPLVF